MKILLVSVVDINRFPPIRTLLQNMLRNGHQVCVISNGTISPDEFPGDLEYIQLFENTSVGPKYQILLDFFRKRRMLRKLVRKLAPSYDVVWTTTDTAVREVGGALGNAKHVMQLMELIEWLPWIPQTKTPKYPIAAAARKAVAVVVPEYNRAHIQKAWWQLQDLPFILPNKPNLVTDFSLSNEEELLFSQLKAEKRKIVLYQGVLYSDRNIAAFARAFQEVSDEYCFCVMSRDGEERRALCKEYPHITWIPFVNPPNHLAFTSLAHIGLTPYLGGTTFKHYSVLNALYCAPNKTFEYAAFKVPMLGTDVPGLDGLFRQYRIGVCCKDFEVSSILSALREIESHHSEFSENCRNYFDSVDLEAILNQILTKVIV
ncbi:MAG: hypothetical protein ACOX6O_10290 [Christensenellales bacterium]|jgi:glycosyltransferase involved in cell wall biosynthesis